MSNFPRILFSPLALALIGCSAIAVGCSDCSSPADGDAVLDAGTLDAAPDATSADARPPACTSNTDCAAPTSVCDTIKGLCVECLVLSDCANKPGAVCSLGACSCPAAGETWCAANTCVDLPTSSDHCGRCDHRCFGACASGRCADPWEPISDVGAPEARSLHAAVWTGSGMVVWGGANGVCAACNLDTGGVYDPSTSTWHATSLVDAPSLRRLASAVWTGSEMIVWGGCHDGHALSSGGRYDPATDTWQPIATTDAPAGRYYHTAVWTGTAMIIWGGSNGTDQLNTGASYDPAADQWTSITAPMVGREGHSAVWFDGAMLTYGGIGDDGGNTDVYLPTASVAGGMAYNPGDNSWASLAVAGQPTARAHHTATVIGDKMVVWGGAMSASSLDTGAVYDGINWVATASPQPAARSSHSAVVLDDPARLIIWGGFNGTNDVDSGGAYDPATNSWATLPAAPAARHDHTAVSTGSSMIIWGGQSGNTRLADGAIYTPR